MKISIFLIFLTFQLSAIGYSQSDKINLQLKNASLKEMFASIEKQTGYKFLYRDDVLENIQVNITAVDMPLTEALNIALENSVNTYRVLENKLIVIAPKETFQVQKVTGSVTDANTGEAIIGANIIIEGTTVGTVTDADGKFTLDINSENAVLVVSFLGYTTGNIKYTGQNTINVQLVPDVKNLDEVVVVGYGIQKKLNLTGSISQVDAKDLTDIPMPTLAQAAMGKASGVFIKNVNGQPGDSDGIEINIRGFGKPLFIIDGMPVSEDAFQQLDPNDIEDFNILKDAASAAVYGARAGNGVILIKTKRGKVSKPTFNYNGNYGLQFITVMPDFVSSVQYAEMENLGRFNQGLDPLWTAEEIQKFRDGSDPIHYPNTDWWGATLRQYAPQSQHNMNVRGGTEKVKYFVSGGYYHQDGMLKSDDIKNNRYSLRSNLDIELTKRFSMGIDINLSNQDYIGPRNQLERGSAVGIMTMLYRARPYYSNADFPDPSYAHGMGPSDVSPVTLSQIENSGFKKWTRLIGDAKMNFAYDLPLGFKARAIFDFERSYYRYKEKVTKIPTYTYNWDTQVYKFNSNTNPMSQIIEKQETKNNLTQQYFLTWDKQLKDHNIHALVVYEALSNDKDNLEASRQDYLFDLDYLFAGPDLNKDNTGSASEGGRKAYIGRINYDYKGKYLVEFNSRYDGSVNFPPETRWGLFPSASLGWRISEEGFIKNNFSFIDNIKLRASHGLLGYDAAGNFQYMATYSIKSNYIYDNSNILLGGVRTNALPNQNITWEKMRTSNIGLDFSFWNRALEGTFEVFYRKRSDVLGARQTSLPNTVGASMPSVNYAEYDNRGFEVNLNHEYHIGEVQYSLGGNFSINREKTLFVDQAKFNHEEDRRINNKIGVWTDQLWTLPTDGLFTSKEEIQGWADTDGKNNATVRPGDVKFIDSNGDGLISGDDRILAGRGTYPRLTYGLNMSLKWKGIEFDMLWQGAGLYNINLKNSPDLTWPFYAGNNPTTEMYNNSYVPENTWLSSNTDARWPLYRTDSYNRTLPSYKTASQFWLINGNYIRLKNVQLAYSLPKSITDRLGIQKLRVYVSGSNLLTFSELDYIDPEIDTDPAKTFGDYHPPLGSYNMGVVLNF